VPTERAPKPGGHSWEYGRAEIEVKRKWLAFFKKL